MGTSWEPEGGEECWSDREAWRGEGEFEAVWGEEPEEETDWPEDLAGPEYWLFKKYGE